MFAVLFPGQGSQSVGMAKELYDKYDLVKKIFQNADKSLGYSISKIILEGDQNKLNLTEHTQPAIFVVSYSIFSVIKSEFNINLNKAKFFAGHSLGEYSALACAGAISFDNAITLLSKRGKSMQSAVPIGVGGMIAILGKEVESIENILSSNDYESCQIANDNCPGQVVVSGKLTMINKLNDFLKKESIKSILLPVSAPFHCNLMSKSTDIMKIEIEKTDFRTPQPKIISNVNATGQDDKELIKNLLIKQIESRVEWRKSINFMIKEGIKQFIEIGPGKVLSGLIKRIDRSLKVSTINKEEDIKLININD